MLKNALSAAFFAACIQSVYRRRNMTIPMVSVMYALMMYMIAYSWNIMWLDVVMVLPLVVLGFEKMMRTGRYLWYILPLAYALIANYYIGFMLCIFLVLYYLVYALRKRRPGGAAGVGDRPVCPRLPPRRGARDVYARAGISGPRHTSAAGQKPPD